jgi:predicted MFS family arabinose efflux permease
VGTAPGEGTRALALATFAMFAQQGLAAYSKTIVPVIAPAMATGLGVDPALTGVWVAIAAFAGIPTTLGAGGLIRRYGALRLSAVATALMGAGLLLGAPHLGSGAGALLAQAASAFVVGAASTISTPASSHLLARLSPPRHAPLVFSIKQTGVPAGLALAGVLGPWFTGLYGWRGALAASALICAALAVALEPARKRFDADRDPRARVGFADVRATVTGVLRHAGLRRLALTCFVFVGLQITVQSFLVVHMVTVLGYDLAEAGFVFGLATLVAIPARIFWGWLGGMIRADALLGWFGVGMFLACCALAALPPEAPVWVTLAAAIAASATALSWHGVLLADIARQAPHGQVGAMTGGVLSFAGLGQMALPALFGAAIAAGLPFAAAWPLIALPALAAAAIIRQRAR